MKLAHHNIPAASETRREAEKNATHPMYAQADEVTGSIQAAAYDGRFGTVGFGCLHPAIQEVLTELGYTVSQFEAPGVGANYLITWK